MEEAALIEQARQGDALALAQLLQQHYLPVKKYLITVTFDRQVAEDLTQETMIRAIQRIGQFGGRSAFSTWLIAIATNLYMDLLRRRQRERRLLQQHEPSHQDEGLSAEWSAVMAQLRAMPRDVSLPIVLKHYHGYSYDEIAQWMGIPVGTVKSRIFNGIRSLRGGENGHDQ